MGSKAKAKQGFVLQRVAYGQAFAQIVVGIAGVGGWKIEGDQADRSAHTAGERGFGDGFGMKIHVGKTGDSAAQHLGARQARAVEDKLR